MAIRKRDESDKITIDLAGPDGNAFNLIGKARNYAEQLGLDKEKISQEMRSKDYKHLVVTFDKYFGEYVDLIMPDSDDEE